MESQDAKQGTLQRNLLIYASVGVLVIGLLGGVITIDEYRGVTNHLKQSEELSDAEEYLGASESLQRAEGSWLVKLLDIRKSSIADLSREIETRIEDQKSYQADWDIADKGDWDRGITLLSEIPSNSFYYQRAQTAVEQIRGKVLAQELETERTNRQSAEDEVERQILALNLVQDALESETSTRLTAESATQTALETAETERLAKEESRKETALQSERADQEQVAKLQAQANTIVEQQRADLEEAAKIQAQSSAQAQQQRADLEEKARIIELAVTNPMIRGVVTGELKFYFEPLPIFAATGVSSAVEDISSSLTSWTPYGTIVRRVFDPNDADLTISWLKNYGTHTIGESIFKSHIKVGIGTDNCLGDWRAFDARTVKKVLWHEIGHSMGYGHSDNPGNVMYRFTETKFDVEQDVSDVIAAGWYQTFPLCGSGSYWYSFESDDSNKGFNVEVLPPGVEASGISSGEGLVYTDCGKSNMIRYTNSCDVAAGAVIYVATSGFGDAVRLDGQIILLDQPVWPDMDWDTAAFQYDDAQLIAYRNLFD